MNADAPHGNTLQAAATAARRGDLDAARALLAQVTQESVHFAATRHLLSQVERRAGRQRAALEAALEAAEAEPANFDYRMGLANAWAALEDWKAAADTSGAALKLQPGSYSGWLAHGNHRLKLSDLERASEAYRKAWALEPARIEAQVNLASCLERLGARPQARDILLDVHAMAPDVAGVLLNLGRNQLALGEATAAIATYRKALALDSRFVDAYINLAIAHLHEQSADEALAVLDRCLTVAPAERSALALQLIAFRQAGRIDEYRQAYAFDALIYHDCIDVPEGYASLKLFNDALAEAVLAHPTLVHEPTGKSTRRGHQTGNLAGDDDGVFAVLKQQLERHFNAFLAREMADISHSYAEWEPEETDFYMWATVLDEQGHQTPHIHPAGWISGVYYVQVPDTGDAATDPEAGWIEFGKPDLDVPGVNPDDADIRRFAARPGELFLFPSYFYHHTVPYRGSRPRISIAFDLIPKSLRRRSLQYDPAALASDIQALVAIGQGQAAVERCREALEHDQNNPEALRFLADVARQRGQNDDAMAMLERAASAVPPWTPARVDLAQLLRRREGPVATRAHIARWLDDSPSIRLRTLHADLGIDLGDFPSAQRELEALLTEAPDTPDAALLYAQLPNPRAELAGRIIAAATDADMPALRTAAGRLLEAQGSFDAAFGHYHAASRQQIDRHGGDATAGRADIGALIETFDAEYFAARSGRGHASDAPIFVVGMPRSGTTLVQQILAAHDRVHALGETNAIFSLVGQLAQAMPTGSTVPQGLAHIAASIYARAGEAYVESTRRSAPASALRWVEKLPQNATLLGVIEAMLPGARVIAVERGRNDTMLSCFANFGGAPFTHDFAALRAACDDHAALMAHWRARLSLPLMTVRYENLVGDFAAQARQIVEFAGVPWQDRCLHFETCAQPVTSGDRFGVRRPVYAGSIGRWRRFARSLAQFDNLFEENAS